LARRGLSRRAALRGLGLGGLAAALGAAGLRSPSAQAAALAASAAGVGAQPAAMRSASSWADVDGQLSALAPMSALLAAELVDGACQPIHAFNADRVL